MIKIILSIIYFSIILSSDVLDQLQDRVIHELYAENIVMGSGWTFFEPDDGIEYSDVMSLWKVTDAQRAKWDAEEKEQQGFWDVELE